MNQPTLPTKFNGTLETGSSVKGRITNWKVVKLLGEDKPTVSLVLICNTIDNQRFTNLKAKATGTNKAAIFVNYLIPGTLRTETQGETELEWLIPKPAIDRQHSAILLRVGSIKDRVRPTLLSIKANEFDFAVTLRGGEPLYRITGDVTSMQRGFQYQQYRPSDKLGSLGAEAAPSMSKYGYASMGRINPATLGIEFARNESYVEVTAEEGRELVSTSKPSRTLSRKMKRRQAAMSY